MCSCCYWSWNTGRCLQRHLATPVKPAALLYSCAVLWYYHASTKDWSCWPCRREVLSGPVKAFSVLSVSSCPSVGMHPLTPGLLLPCHSGFPPPIFFLCSALILLLFAYALLFPQSNLTVCAQWCMNYWRFQLEFGTLLEMALCSACLLVFSTSMSESESCRSTAFL